MVDEVRLGGAVRFEDTVQSPEASLEQQLKSAVRALVLMYTRYR
jgi:hypothetical protein